MKRNKDFILREIYGKAILMPIRKNNASNNPIYLNDMAVAIWKMAENTNNVAELIVKICKLYNLQSGSVEETAVKNYILQLIDYKLLFE